MTTIDHDHLKKEIMEYIKNEMDHLNEGINYRFEPISTLSVQMEGFKKELLEKIEANYSKLDVRILTVAELEKISYAVAKDSQRKFWNNFRWFIGVSLVLILAAFVAGIDTWSVVRDYTTYRDKTESKIEKNVDDINTLQREAFNSDVAEDIKHIRDKLK